MYFCAIANKKYLAHVRVLAKSILAVHPSAQVYFLLADRLDGYFDPSAEPFHMVLLEDLGHADMVDQMAFYSHPFEFCCALRGLFHKYMWEQTPAAAWIFLDSDILVMDDMSSAFDALTSSSLLLNPNQLSPAGDDQFVLSREVTALTKGLFNGGFLGIRRCEQSSLFIDWFTKRLFRYCLDIPGLYVDQLWLTLVPHFFRDVALYTHPGANLAHWNLDQRTITRDAQGKYLIDGKPLLFVHFSGWNIDHPGDVSKYAPRYRDFPCDQLPAWKELGERYRSALLENGYLVTSQWPYAFERFDNGMVIKREMQGRQYREFWNRVPQRASPFARGGEFA